MRLALLIGALLMTAPAQAADWKLVIHGGAGVIERSRMTPEKEREIRAGLDRALAAGSAVLERGGASLETHLDLVDTLWRAGRWKRNKV